MTVLRRWLGAFGHFWWDFLVGDTPEFAVATAVIVAVALLVGHHSSFGYLLLPVVAIGFLVASTYRGRRRPASSSPAQSSESEAP